MNDPDCDEFSAFGKLSLRWVCVFSQSLVTFKTIASHQYEELAKELKAGQ